MKFWTYNNLARITRGTWRIAPVDGDAVLPAALCDESSGHADRIPILWHDTRELQPGQCYLAIAGENFDGHDFIHQAFQKEAAMTIANTGATQLAQQAVCESSPILEVPDTIVALQTLARAYRDELAKGTCKVIGVAGSNGKTTTRHLIHHVLTHAGQRGTQSPKSFNNHLGVPLTLLSARPTDDFVACEIGTNHPGEIDFLSAIARPDIAVITSIGEEHLEFFGDIEGVTKEELSIANHFDNETMCLVGSTVPWHNSPLEPAVLRAEPLAHAAKEIRRVIDPTHDPTRECAHLAAWTALVMGVEFDDAVAAMRCATTPPGRWEKLRFAEGVTIINDAYNANPTSLHEAINAFCDQPADRRVFIFGEMYELGDASHNAHSTVGEYLGFLDIDLFISIGEMTRPAFEMTKDEKPSRFFPEWSDDLPEKIAAMLEPGDTVLLKASRGMRLERLIPAIEKRFGRAAPTDGICGLRGEDARRWGSDG